MKIYELLDSPDKWTQGAFANDERGVSVGPNDKLASRWCMAGALDKCYPREGREEAAKKLREFADEAGISIALWNDAPDRTYAEVLELCRRLDV